MNILGKICTSPFLLKTTTSPESQWTQEYKDMMKILPRHLEESDYSLSGKLIALVGLLNTLRNTTDEKVIVVSQYTKTLDLVEAICTKMRWTRTRLDGSTPQNERDTRVSVFNRELQASCFVFLLSLKAGGVGLNLVGASRLILLDSSWNPANDLQAMARIHRDGQKKPVHIYRFLTAGTIDEKIYMRQVIKTGLSNALMATDGDGKSKVDSFTPAELRDLFRINPHSPSHTHDLLFCNCASTAEDEDEEDDAEKSEKDDGDALDDDSDAEAPHRGWMLASDVQEKDVSAKAKKMKRDLAILDEWTHINCMSSAARQGIKDPLLRAVVCKAYDKKSGEKDAGKEDEAGEVEPSRADMLLAQVDIEKMREAVGLDDEGANALTNMSDVPAGAVTFLFTKCSM